MSLAFVIVLFRLLRFGWPHRALLWAAFACMAVLGLTTGAYAYLIGPALKFLLSGGTEGMGLVAKWFPQVSTLDRQALLWLLPGLIVGIGILKGGAYLGQFFWMGWFGQHLVADLRKKLFEKFSSLSVLQLGEARTGDLLSRFSADVAQVELAAIYTLSSYVRDGLQIAVLVFVAIAVSWKIALGCLVLLPISVLPAGKLTRMVLARIREGQAQLGELAAQLKEGIGGIRTIQAYNAQADELKRFALSSQRQRRAMVQAAWARGAVPGLMEVLAACAIACLLLVVGWLDVPPESLVSVLAAVVLIYQPAKDLGRVTQFAVQATAAAERVFEILDSSDPVADLAGAQQAPALREAVEIEDVEFSYRDRPALCGLSFSLPIGKVTALVGESGGGKSTVGLLLLRFARPSRGRILLDGVEAERYTIDSVRRQFALVTQEPLLFSDTIEENIRLGRPSASSDEVAQAARIAQADEFIRRLPEGMATRIGERGVVLSGGQKQRLCLARAILSDASVLVLDEATSNLDPQSESEVRAALGSALVGRTALVIAHRLSNVVEADRIHVVEAGRIVESGTHGELIRQGRTYARLWSLQQGSMEAA